MASRMLNRSTRASKARAAPASRRPALLVDDVGITQKVTKAALHQAGFQCSLAGDGEVAVAMAKKQPFFVILMDVQLPKLDGVQATAQIREFERSSGIATPALIFGLTASCKPDDLARYMEAGMDGCIEKGCIVSRAMHEALAMHKESPSEFVFINSRNVQSFIMGPDLPEMVLTPKGPISTRRPSSTTDMHLSKMVEDTTAVVGSTAAPVSPRHSLKNRALLVDDVKITAKLVSKALVKSGYHVDIAADGRQAVDMAAANKYHVILMDVQLPILDGVSATAAIRAAEADDTDDSPVILGLTASCGEDRLRVYADAGMDGCIQKGCVVSRAMHEALAMLDAFPGVFVFVDDQNAHFKLVTDEALSLPEVSP